MPVSCTNGNVTHYTINCRVGEYDLYGGALDENCVSFTTVQFPLFKVLSDLFVMFILVGSLFELSHGHLVFVDFLFAVAGFLMMVTQRRGKYSVKTSLSQKKTDCTIWRRLLIFKFRKQGCVISQNQDRHFRICVCPLILSSFSIPSSLWRKCSVYGVCVGGRLG